ncbi:hypothetical protein P43SY_009123 [Pythium insidiosum]|uniref:WHIM1 domain-containing protein n=1 Tax=Pythium insidiosum TaxID=114742 RepID=A0AAD5M018_PYTIN|nr:hypothetical protein P43SY_009123 [Pythium insidiosum]
MATAKQSARARATGQAPAPAGKRRAAPSNGPVTAKKPRKHADEQQDDSTTQDTVDEEEEEEEEEEEREERADAREPGEEPADDGAELVPAKRKTTKKAPAAKKPAKKKAAAAASATAQPNGTKKRKVRTLADKQRENAAMEKPFFTEDGSDWHGHDVELDELAELRAMHELPAACHILWLLQQPLTIRVGTTLLEFERALLMPESSVLLEDVFTKLLLKKSERDCLSAGIGLKYEWWNKQLREYYMAMYERLYALLRKAGEKVPATTSLLDSSEDDSDDEERDVELSDDEWLALEILKSRLDGLGMICPLQHKSFGELPVVLRCKILLNLCEAVVEDPVNTDYIRQMEEDDLRIEPLGRDRVGNWFYFFPQFYEERRMYRLEMETKRWDLWAKGDDAFRAMHAAMKSVRGRKSPGEQELLDHLEVILEQIEEDAEARARELEKATKKAILEAIPRKRSLRIQVKQLEEMEKKQEEETKKVLTQEEIAEMKRAEFLRKVEQDAQREAREREREARRVAKEEQEREAAQAEREQRRLRRLEKEKREAEEQQRQEELRRQQEEARMLRAMQRTGGDSDSGADGTDE